MPQVFICFISQPLFSTDIQVLHLINILFYCTRQVCSLHNVKAYSQESPEANVNTCAKIYSPLERHLEILLRKYSIPCS